MFIVLLVLLIICSLELFYLILILADDKEPKTKNELVQTVIDIEKCEKENVKLQKKKEQLKSINIKIDNEISLNKVYIEELKKQARNQSKELKIIK